jgi:ribosomal protein S18 acetylase RimI-like enzyme
VRIRRARPEEYAEIGAVTIAAYEPFLVGAEDGYRLRLLDVAGRDREAEVWVATTDEGDEILGNVTVCPEGSAWRELAKDDEGEFRMLAVSPAAQGRGVGGALAEFVVERFRAERASAVVLSSLPDMSAAHGIYERLGFRRDPDLDWHPMPDVDLIAYRLEL